MALMLLAHWLYTNACVKGEECIVPTWDIAHEKWGWMLCFWNLAGVPVMYTFNSMYLLGWKTAHSVGIAHRYGYGASRRRSSCGHLAAHLDES